MGRGKITRDPNNPIDRAVVQFQAGRDREENFLVIYERFYPPVRSFFAKRIKSDDALDLTQETFLGIYTGLDRYRWEAAFPGWLFCIASNAYRKWCRRRIRIEHPNAPQLPPGNTKRTARDDQELIAVDSRKTPLEELLTNEQLMKLTEAIEQLSPKMQQCLKLRLYQELAYKEIADFMELEINTVKAHLHQAKKKLEEKLKDDFRGIEF